jgi:uncharacterized protein (DUF58 family)
MSDTLLDAQTRETLRHLELSARDIVSGLRYGLHRSKRRGTSSDFLHHRGYLPGDPLRHLDWRVYARTERYYIKQFVEDSVMALWLVMDGSGSMFSESEVRYRGNQAVALPSKYAVACRLGAALACLAMNQQDRAGLVIGGGALRSVPLGSSPAHLSLLLHRLAAHTPEGRADPLPALRMVEEEATYGSLIVLLSDLSYDPDPVQQCLRTLRARNHDVIIMAVATPQEAEFDFSRWVDFRCAEQAAVRHRLDATLLQRLYREEYEALLERWRAFCRKQRVDFVHVRTDENVTAVLNSYLQRRMDES